MSKEGNRQNTGYITLDVSYLIRRILRTAFVTVMCAIIVGIGAYIVLDTYMQETYTANINLTVLARDNNSGKQAEYNVNAAVTRNVNVLNSDTLKEKIKKSEAAKGIDGTVAAAQIPGTNLISLSATAATAEDSLRLLKAATESYPELAEYFESGYVIKNMNSFSADNIVKNQPKVLQYALLAVVFVLMAGTGLTVLIAMFSDKIYSREQGENLLDMDILGVLYRVKKRKGQKGLLVSDAMTDPAFIEGMDRLTTHFQQKMDHRGFKIVTVSSIHENEGKTTLAVNLALNLVERGKRVALIEGDLRKPSLSKILEKNVSEGTSVSDLLEGKAELSEVMDRSEKYKGLICLWQKKSVPEADRLLDSEQMKKLLQAFRNHTDYVIIDTSPIGIVRDTEILAGLSDAVVLSIRQSEERAAALNDVTDILEEAGTTVIGGVINMAYGKDNSRKRSRYGKYYYDHGNRKNEGK